jgi:hypothetical protein
MLPVSIVDSQSLTFEFVEGRGMFDGEHVVFDVFGRAVIEGLIKCSIIPLDVRGQLSETDHVAVDMMGVEHFELSNSSLGRLNDVRLTEKTIEFIAENTPTAPNGRLGVESKKWLPPDQGDVTEVGCCIGDTLSFVLEFSRLVVEDHDTAGDERSEKASVMICLFYQDHPDKMAQHPKELPRLIIQSLRRTPFASSSLAFTDLTDSH